MAIEHIQPASRAEWLAIRRQDITASVAACLLGVHPYTTAYQLWAEKTGRVSADGEDTPALRRGRLLEPVAIELLREMRPTWQITYSRDYSYWRDTAARIGGTPDAFATRPETPGFGIAQVKTVSDHAWRKSWIDPDTREVVVPLWVAVQAIIEATLTGASWAVVAPMVVGHGLDLNPVDVPIHAGIMTKVREAVADFWRTVAAGEHPPIDWMRDGETVLDVYGESNGSMATIADVTAFNNLVARYRLAKDAAKEASDEAEMLRPQIIDLLGNSDGAESGAFRVTAKTQHRRGYEVKPSSSRVLRVKDKRKEAA